MGLPRSLHQLCRRRRQARSSHGRPETVCGRKRTLRTLSLLPINDVSSAVRCCISSGRTHKLSPPSPFSENSACGWGVTQTGEFTFLSHHCRPTTLLTPPPPTKPQFFRHLRAAKNYQLGRRRRKLTCPCLSRAGVSSGICGGDEMLWSWDTTGRHAIKPFLGSPFPPARKCLFPRYN